MVAAAATAPIAPQYLPNKCGGSFGVGIRSVGRYREVSGAVIPFFFPIFPPLSDDIFRVCYVFELAFTNIEGEF